MIKRITLMIILILSLSAPTLAAEPGTGIIEGRIVNGTEGGSSVADQDITLTTYLNNTEAGSATTKTDADGYFVFEALSTEPSYDYRVVLTFQEAEYYSEWLSFDEGETSKSVEVTVYDSTTSDEAIKTAISHTIIYVEPGSLMVIEYFLFINESDRTYIGSREVPTPGGKETLRFSLPEGATELQPGAGLMQCCIYDSDEGFIDTMPVLPGAREIVYSYRVNYNPDTYVLSRTINYPTASYDLLVQGENIEIGSDQLTPAETLDIEGKLFKHVSGTDFAPGDILVASIFGLPQTNNPQPVLWVAVLLTVLALGLGFGYLLKRKRVQLVSRGDSLNQRKQRLLLELAQLDDDFEDGKIPEESYQRLRAVVKAQLVELMQKSREESGGR